MSATSPDPRRRLLVMRHAKAASPDDTPDHERPLAGRGRRDAPMVGAWLVDAGWVPDVGAELRRHAGPSDGRARPGGDRARPAPTRRRLRLVGGLYEASVHQVLHVVAEAGEHSTVMVVGHEPTMSAVVATLTGQRADFPTSAVAQVELSVPWGGVTSGSGRLMGLRTPR